ncbi:septation protein IspZ [Ectothiorhodospiraceae bacterium WFHF3C12]|nr:septation protein IspZ [Ectothiorhodospiraceae bacterium WFHF3C12]
MLARYLNRHILFELAPGIVFLAVNYGSGLMWATAAVVVASVFFTVLGVVVERRVPVFPIVTVALVIALGGATLVFQDETFIKMKPTIGKLLFAGALAFGLAMKPNLLARALEGQIYLTGRGWAVLTLRWIACAIAFAALNEFVWRTQDTDTWVAFKVALTPVSIVFYVAITRMTAPAYWDDAAAAGQLR